MSRALPEAVGSYRVEAEIGRGGMGVVYRARDAEGRAVAIKVLDSPLEDAVSRFARETAIQIEHPNVVRVLDYGAEGERPFIVLELLQGETLADRLRRGPIGVKEGVDLGIQLCFGLEAIHAAGVVHRDLKPTNVLITNDGVVKLIDFGIAYLADSDLTKSGMIIGTPTHLSPEQVCGLRDLDGRSDIFSLGTVLYFALTGRAPFSRKSAVATMFAVASEQPPLPSALIDGVPSTLDDAIMRALAKDRDRRWQSALDFRFALDRIDMSTGSRRPRTIMEGTETRVVAVLLAQGVRDRELLEDAVRSRQGRLVALVGNRSVAVYGEHTRAGDETVRAALSALEAEGAAECLAIASGRAVVERFGIDQVPIERAERLAAIGRSGIIMSAEEADALGSGFRFEAIGIARRLIARSTSRTERSAPLLGREPIVAQIRDLMERALEDRAAGGALLVGPAGIGKTAVMQAVMRTFEAIPNAHVFFGQTHSHRRGLSFSLFASAISEKAIAPLAATFPTEAQADARAFLSTLLRLEPPPSAGLLAAKHDPRLMADRLRLTLLDLMAQLCAKGPVALFLEEVQWADAESLELLRDLARRRSGALFVLATARPELRHQPGLTTIELSGLRRRDVGRLASRIAGIELAQPVTDAIAERTAGNPMFVEHIVRELLDRGLLDRSIDRLPLPITVEAAVQSRLDSLPKEIKECLKHAAIYRGRFSANAIAALGIDAARERLEALIEQNLIMPGYRFASELVAEVAERMLSPEQREMLHAKAGAHLSATDGSPEEIALHFEAGNETERAARAYVQAAHAAAARGDSRAVVSFSDRALGLHRTVAQYNLHMIRADALQFLGQRDEAYRSIEAALSTAATRADRARAMAERAWWLHRVGRHAEALVAAELAVTAARRAMDREVLAIALGRRILALIHAGRLEQAQASLDEAERIAETGSTQLKALATGWRAQLAAARGDLGERLAAFERAVSLYLEAGDVRRAAGARVNLADAHNRFGAYDVAIAALDEALEDCRRVGHRLMEGYALMNLGYARMRRGETAAALAALALAKEIAEQTQEARLDVFVRTYDARARMSSEPRLALASAEEAGRDAVAAGQPMIGAVAFSVAAQAALDAGDVVAALPLSARAYELMKKVGSMEEGEAEVYLVRASALSAAHQDFEAEAVREEGRRALLERADSIADRALRSAFFNAVEAHQALMYNR